MWEKTTTVHKLQNTLWERSTTTRIHRGNDLLSSSLPHAAVTVEATTSHSLSVSIHTLYTTNLQKCSTTLQNVCPKSYLYIYDFRVIYTCVPFQSIGSNQSGRISTGSSVIRFTPSIRRDLFPNRLPLHSGIGCRSNPICFRHAPCLSGVSTLVSMSDLFSVMWIFVSTNSRSSTHSRIQ